MTWRTDSQVDSLSVIVTAHNNEAVLSKTLQSVEQALAFWRASSVSSHANAEVIVVDDGSTDNTVSVLQQWTKGKSCYQVIGRRNASSPSCARNVGAAAAHGDLLFFLDGDDLFLPRHIAACCLALADPATQFVKTGVRLADPVHADWRPRIEHSIVINLCVRRHCHVAIGGFPDYHLCMRAGDEFRPVSDIFYKFEDMYYNQLLAALYPGVRVAEETVQSVRYPGNAYDRQYEKFRRPFGAYREELSADHRFRLRLCDAILEARLPLPRAEAGTQGTLPNALPCGRPRARMDASVRTT
jgi:glycosyltransferase involved in cell wall biosynthesis